MTPPPKVAHGLETPIPPLPSAQAFELGPLVLHRS